MSEKSINAGGVSRRSLLRLGAAGGAGAALAPDLHAEPSFNLAANGSPADNLSRSLVEVPDLTPEQAGYLLSKKTPIRNAMASRGVTAMPSMKETDEKIRSIQDRLNGH